MHQVAMLAFPRALSLPAMTQYVLAPAFRWNHGQVTAEGGGGIARHSGAKLLDMNAA